MTDNTGFHGKMNEAAQKEMQQPLKTLVDTVKGEGETINGIRRTLVDNTKSVIGTVLSKPVEVTGKTISASIGITGKLSNAFITTPIGWAGNILRAGADGTRFILRLPAVGADYVSVGIGKISAIAESVNQRAKAIIASITGKIDETTRKIADKLDIGKSK